MTTLLRVASESARLSLIIIVLTAVFSGGSYAQSYDSSFAEPQVGRFDRPPSKSAGNPQLESLVHMNGRLWTTIVNNGVVGNIFGIAMPNERKTAPSFYYPEYSRIQHGYYTGLWIGGVVGNDTLVTTAIDEMGQREFYPDAYPFGDFVVKSSDPNSPYYSSGANGEVEYQATFTDTFEDQPFVPYNSYDDRTHKSMHLRVTQSSYSWSHRYAQDFIIVDYRIGNIGRDTINSAWIGIYYNGCNHHRGEMPYPIPDDVEGYIYSAPHEFKELGDELLRIAWCLDKDGWAGSFGWDFVNTPHVFGIAPLHVPTGATDFNFNWWNGAAGSTYNWGPRRQGTPLYPFRSFYGGYGRPLSDRNRYYLMSKPEIDYNGFEAAVDHTDEGWLPPDRSATRIASGHQVNLVSSFGPFTLPPGKVESFAVVLAIGEDAHTDPNAYRELFDPRAPKAYENYLDFDDLITNVRWARVIYDNPGVDTDNDGDSGRWFIHYDEVTQESVKVFYEGDGVPDFRGASPPPPPPVRVSTEDGRIILRWNGYDTENNIDPMTRVKDFEGYRVYMSRSPNDQEAVLLASYDHIDFNRYTYNPQRERYELKEIPFTLDSLRAMYGEDFDPLAYYYHDPFEFGGHFYYFEPVDYNQADYRSDSLIHRVYPDALPDTSDVDEEGRIRFYEWEYVIEDLQPTLPYWVSVTAFDFGHPAKSLDPLESPVGNNMIPVYAQSQGDAVLKDGKLNVYVYPNPYRTDDNYYARGLENRLDELGTDRARSVYFANLPNHCRISLLSLDGDLIRSVVHDEPEGSGTASVYRFNLISRNNEALVCGLYYWVVESEYGSQLGKLVILK